MRIFLSYASEDRALVEPVRYALAEQGHDVFFDREDLPPGHAFDSRIRAAIERCDLFICFLTPHTVDAGSYTLNELQIAQRIAPHPSGRVLPVKLAELPMSAVPAYLRSVTILEPEGNVAAAVADAVHRIHAARRRTRTKLIVAFTVALVAVAASIYWLVPRNTKDASPRVLVEAGMFTMGDDEHSPRREVYVSAFHIDATEVTTRQYDKFLRATGSLTAPPEWERLDLASEGDLPVVAVMWHEAAAYCHWVGMRLPREAEWEKAARGADERLYPWGNDEPTAERAVFGRDAEYAYDGGLAPVGSHEEGRSAAGAYDLAGNASEWVSDWFAESFPIDAVRDPTGPADGVKKVIRGSGWRDAAERLEVTRRYFAAPDHRSDDIGFRCAKEAD